MPEPRFDLRLALLTLFGLGASPVAPGTVGSLPPVLASLALASVLGPHWSVDACVLLTGLAAGIACVRFGAQGEAAFGGKDPGRVVADEVAGQCVALLMLPWSPPGDGPWRNLALAGMAFAAFRFFDIVKVPPAAQVQRWKAGWGVLADDLIAGVYAALTVQLLARLAFGWGSGGGLGWE